MVPKWLPPLLLIAIGLFLIKTDYADGVRDSWIGTAILFLIAGAVIWDVARRSLRERREAEATRDRTAGLYAPWNVHLLNVCAFFGVAIAVNVVLDAMHGDLWGWSSFLFGVVCGAAGTLWYYWPRIRRPRGRLP